MNKSIIALCFSLVIFLASCQKKDVYNWTSAPKADIPVTVSNLYGSYGVPTVATSIAGGGIITIQLNIPSNSGRTIKEITRVGYNSSVTGYGSVQKTSMSGNTSTSGVYTISSKPGSGTSVTFSTTLTEYYNIIPPSSTHTLYTSANAGTATSFLGRYFYFLITLDNGEQLIPVPVRVYVNS